MSHLTTGHGQHRADSASSGPGWARLAAEVAGPAAAASNFSPTGGALDDSPVGEGLAGLSCVDTRELLLRYESHARRRAGDAPDTAFELPSPGLLLPVGAIRAGRP